MALQKDTKNKKFNRSEQNKTLLNKKIYAIEYETHLLLPKCILSE